MKDMKDMNRKQRAALDEYKKKIHAQLRHEATAKAKIDNTESKENTLATLERKAVPMPTSKRRQLTRDALQMLYNSKQGLLDQMSCGHYSTVLKSDVKFLKQLLEELENKGL